MTEDLTTYTEVDGQITKTVNRVTVTDFDRANQNSKLYKDFGIDFFKDFVHQFEVRCTSTTIYSWWICWGLANAVTGTASNMVGREYLIRLGSGDPAQLRIYIYEFNNGVSVGGYSTSPGLLSLNTTYYLTITKSGTSIQVDIYDDAARQPGDLLDTLNLTVTDEAMRYLYVTQTYGSGSSLRKLSGWGQYYNVGWQEDLKAVFEVGQNSANLKAFFRLTREDLKAEFIVRQSRRIGKHTAWVQAAPQLDTEDRILSLTTLDGEIYGGTGRLAGKLFKWNGVNAWIEVAPQLFLEDRIFSLTVLNGEIYGGTGNNGKLVKWNGSNAWILMTTQINPSQHFLGGTQILSLVVLNGEIYGGEAAGGYLYKWNGVDAWTQVAFRLNDQGAINALVVLNGEIYGGTSPGGRLFKWNGSNAWIEVAGQLNSETDIYSLAVVNGEIYAGTAPNGNLFKWNGSDAWIQVAPQLNDQEEILALAVADGKIYGGTFDWDTSGANLFKWNGSNAWIQVAPQLNNQDAIYSLTVLNGEIYGGTGDNANLFNFPAHALLGEFIVRHSDFKELFAEFDVMHWLDLYCKTRIRKILNFEGSLGIGFLWWGSGGWDQLIEFEMVTPTGSFVGKFPDGPAAWRWVLLSFEQLQEVFYLLEEVDIDGTRPDRSRVIGLLWTYHSEGIRRVDYIVIWRGFDLKAVFIVRQLTSVDLSAEMFITRPDSEVLKAIFEVGQGSANLPSEFIVGQWQESLLSEFTIRQASSQELFAQFRVNPP